MIQRTCRHGLHLLAAVSMLGIFSVPAWAQRTTNFPVIGEVLTLSPELSELIDPQAKIEVLSSGFEWTEGPLWVPEDNGPGYLLFSNIPRNTIMKWSERGGLSVYMTPSGYTGITDYGREPGSNGLARDAQGRLICCEHGDRRVSILTPAGGKRTLVDAWQGKRLNSPNDVIVKSNGHVYFTDPPYGLRKQLNDPTCELGFCGVYHLTPSGELSLLAKDMTRPNGIAFSPDESILYVAQSDAKAALWKAFDMQADGSVGASRVFADVTADVGKMKGLPDGLKVDVKGNLFASGPGGLLVFNAEGKQLGRISTGEAISNCAFGGPDGSMLYITSDMYICRIQTKTRGAGIPAR